MKYIKKRFTVEKIAIEKIAEKYGTPAYCYSFSILRDNINSFKKSFESFSPLICFAIKSNSNLSIIKEIKKLGLGADVVSKGELVQAIKAGINPKKIVFSGVGKTSSELNYAVNKKILLINSESKSEVMEIEKIAKSKKKIVDIGIRLNPNTDAKTLNKISTGKKGDKFGVNQKTFIELVNYLKKSKYINLKCLSVHIGSQIFENKPYEKMLKVIDKIISKIKFKFDYIDLGGGMGISYDNSKKKDKQINSLIAELKPLIQNIGDAPVVVPLIKEYLEIGVKNDEHLIKMMAVIQRITNNSTTGGGDSLLTDEELKQLQQIAEEVAKDESKTES